MSVKGFKVGTAASEQYDYNYLDNKPDLSVYATKTEVAAVDDVALAAYATDTATGAIASFPDGADGIPMKSVLCAINPVQDLHGYGAPWPDGGGKNKGNFIDGKGIDSSGNIIDQSGRCATVEPIPIDANNSYVVSATDANFIYAVWNGSTFVRRMASTPPGTVLDTSGGTELYVAAYNSDPVTVAGCKPMVEIGTTPTTPYAPYSNICPISGFTGLTLTRTGKNLANMIYDGYVPSLSTGQLVPYNGTHSQFIRAIPLTTYAYSFGDNAFNVIFEYDGNKNFLKNTNASAVTGNITTSAQTGYIMLRCDISGSGHDVPNSQLEIGSTATAYEPYICNTYPVSWQSSAGTVYGGTLDVTSGKLTVDRVCKTLNTARNLSGTYAGSIIYNSSSPETSDADFAKPFICNRLNYVGNSFSANYKYGTCINAYTTSFNLWVNDVAFASLNEASAWLASNTTQICYYLATPIVYQLTPTEVDSLLGANNLWHDANGNTTANYRADVTLYIAKKIAAVQALILEN